MEPADRQRRRGAGARRGVQPHARPPLGGVRGPARIRRRRLARAAHAADRDPRTARGAGRAGEPSGEEVRRVERLVQAEITRISRLVDDLLLLAQAEQTRLPAPRADRRAARSSTSCGTALSLTAERRFELGPIPEGTLAGRSRPPGAGAAQPRPQRDRAHRRGVGPRPARGRAPRAGQDPLRRDRRRAGHPRARARADLRALSPHRPRHAAASAGGAGLGLAIVRAIAEAHGGQVRARDPRDGRGARVELILPGFSEPR